MTDALASSGGYDEGYHACACFWGRQPGTLVLRLLGQVHPRGISVLDAGCGEGKNAIYLARRGAAVRAIDISALAIKNARIAWPDAALVDWEISDIRTAQLGPQSFAVVIAYGLLHCLPDLEDLHDTARKLQAATLPGGYHLVCAFNDRFQDLGAHPGFEPTLLSHGGYVELYRGWEFLHVSDQDLFESHPHNRVPHVHSMTRLLARKGGDE